MPLVRFPTSRRLRFPAIRRFTDRLNGLIAWWHAHPAYRSSQTWPSLIPGVPPFVLTNMAANRPASGWSGTLRPGGLAELRGDGVAAYATLSTLPTTFNVAQGTLLCWALRTNTASGEQWIVTFGDGSDSGSNFLAINFLDSTDTLRISIASGGPNTLRALTAPNFPVGVWYHLAFTGGPQGNALYVNAEPQTLTYTTGSPATTDWLATIFPTLLSMDVCRLNTISFPLYFPGPVDDVMLYNRQLSPLEIADVYQASLGGWRQEFTETTQYHITSAGAGNPTTIGVAPARITWSGRTVGGTYSGSYPVLKRDSLTYRVGDTATFYLQTISPDDGSERAADTLPTYRIYEAGVATAIATGTYTVLDPVTTPLQHTTPVGTVGFYVAQVSLTGVAFLPEKQYIIRSSWTIVGASEAQIETFQLDERVIDVAPAQVTLQPSSQLFGPFIHIRPARVVAAPQLGGRASRTITVSIAPATVGWAARRTLGRLFTITPARVRRQPQALPFRRGAFFPPIQVRMRAGHLIITGARPLGHELGSVSDFFVTGDWLIQSQRLGFKFAFAYAPDTTWEHRLLAISPLQLSVALGGGLATVGNLTFTVAETGTGHSMIQSWQALVSGTGSADVTVDFLQNDGTTLRLFTGIIDTITVRNGRSEVACVDESIQRNLQLPQRLVTADTYAVAASGALTQPIPLVYGVGSQITAAPLLFTNTIGLGYTAATHPMSMATQIAVFNPQAQIFMPGPLSGLADSANATVFLSTPLQQQLLNTQHGTMIVTTEIAVTNAAFAVDGNSNTLAQVLTNTLGSNFDGQGILGAVATPTSSQRGNNQVMITMASHRCALHSDPTVTGQLTVNTVDGRTGTPLRSALFVTDQFRHKLNPLTTSHTITNLALGDAERLQLVLQARNEGGLGAASNFYEVTDMSLLTAYVPQGDTTPVFLYQAFNGRRDLTGTVTPNGANALYTFPNHIIGSLLVDELGLALSPSVLAANTFYMQHNYVFAGGIGYGWYVTRATARQILQDAAWQASAILSPDLQGKWGLHPYDVTATPQMTFDASTILCVAGAQDGAADDSTSIVLGNMADVHCRYEVHYAWNAGAQKFDQMMYAYENGSNVPGRDDLRRQCQISAIRYGKTEPLIVQAYWIATQEAALALLDHLVNYFAFQRLMITFDTTLRAISLRLGDMVTVTHPLLPANDNAGNYEIHTLQIDPLAGRVTVTASKRTVANLAYFIIQDQTGVPWYWWFDEAGQLTRDNVLPNIANLSPVEVTGQTAIPSWHHVIDSTGTAWFLYPDFLGELQIDTAPPALGFGFEAGAGLAAIAINGTTYRLGASGGPEQITITPS